MILFRKLMSHSKLSIPVGTVPLRALLQKVFTKKSPKKPERDTGLILRTDLSNQEERDKCFARLPSNWDCNLLQETICSKRRLKMGQTKAIPPSMATDQQAARKRRRPRITH